MCSLIRKKTEGTILQSLKNIKIMLRTIKTYLTLLERLRSLSVGTRCTDNSLHAIASKHPPGHGRRLASSECAEKLDVLALCFFLLLLFAVLHSFVILIRADCSVTLETTPAFPFYTTQCFTFTTKDIYLPSRPSISHSHSSHFDSPT